VIDQRKTSVKLKFTKGQSKLHTRLQLNEVVDERVHRPAAVLGVGVVDRVLCGPAQGHLAPLAGVAHLLDVLLQLGDVVNGGQVVAYGEDHVTSFLDDAEHVLKINEGKMKCCCVFGRWFLYLPFYFSISCCFKLHRKALNTEDPLKPRWSILYIPLLRASLH